jgi:uncharacterized membrane protein
MKTLNTNELMNVNGAGPATYLVNTVATGAVYGALAGLVLGPIVPLAIIGAGINGGFGVAYVTAGAVDSYIEPAK